MKVYQHYGNSKITFGTELHKLETAQLPNVTQELLRTIHPDNLYSFYDDIKTNTIMKRYNFPKRICLKTQIITLSMEINY